MSDASTNGSNRPLATAVVMLIGALTGLPILIAAVMAYLFKGEAPAGGWERTHYSYHIRTFWLSILFAIVGGLLLIVGVGILILLVLPLWLVVRSVIPLLKAANREPMPSPYSWLF